MYDCTSLRFLIRFFSLSFTIANSFVFSTSHRYRSVREMMGPASYDQLVLECGLELGAFVGSPRTGGGGGGGALNGSVTSLGSASGGGGSPGSPSMIMVRSSPRTGVDGTIGEVKDEPFDAAHLVPVYERMLQRTRGEGAWGRCGGEGGAGCSLHTFCSSQTTHRSTPQPRAHLLACSHSRTNRTH